LLGPLDKNIMRQLGGFALMSATSALIVPLAQVLIRNGLANRLGWEGAGLWQALWKVSEIHLMLLTTTLSLYFLPRFSEIRDAAELRAEVLKGYRFVLPLVLASAVLLYLARAPLIHGLFTAEFLPLVDVFGWQLFGDVLKISSWILAYTLISRAQTKAVIVTEIAFGALLVALTLGGAALDGLRGTAIGYALTYATYGATMFYLFTRMLAVLSATGELGVQK
jgi:polysaccharide transporter, PST family